MKKLITLILTGCMVAALAACGSSSNSGSTDAATTPAASTEAPATTVPANAVEEPTTFAEETEAISITMHDWFRGDYYVYTSNADTPVKKTPKDTIVYGSSSQVVAADPNGVQEEYTFSHNVYDCLIDRDLSGKTDFIPALATEWGYNSNGDFEITLREGVKFHDGTTLDADDVIFTFQRIAGSNVNKCSTSMRSIDFEKTAKTDDLHLTIVFTNPVGSFLSDLASGFCGIVSKEYIENNPDATFLDSDAGSGPYMITETVTGVSQNYVAFDDYWAGAPEVKNIIYKVYKDYSVMAIDFLNGDLDLACNNNYNTVSQFLMEQIPGATMFQLPGRTLLLTMATLGGAPLSDIRLREALAASIDYEGLISGVYQSNDMAQVSTSIFPPGYKYRVDLDPIAYDEAKAISLMTEAGYSTENPCHLTLLTTQTSQNYNSSVIIQEYAKKVGFDIEIIQVDSASAPAEAADTSLPPKYDLYVVTSSYNTGSPENALQRHEMYSSPATQSTLSGIDDAHFNEVAQKAAYSTDEEERAQLYKEIQEMFNENLWEINLHYYYGMGFAWNYVENVEFLSSNHPAFVSLKVSE